MQNDQLASGFLEGLFKADEERLIVRRLSENADELQIIDELLSSKLEEPAND
jgi:hypothetical protein